MRGSQPRATLADLLDRVLDRGVHLQADVVITVAGVPLLGLSLRAILGGMETLRSHGIFVDWDAAIREEAARAARGLPGAAEAGHTAGCGGPPGAPASDAPLLELPAAFWDAAVSRARWETGRLVLTAEGLWLRGDGGAPLLHLPYGAIWSAATIGATAGRPASLLRLERQGGAVWLHAAAPHRILAWLRSRGVPAAVALPRHARRSEEATWDG